MKIVVVLAALALLAGCGDPAEDEPEAPREMAALTVTVDDGKTPKTVEVHCETPSDSKACNALAGVAEKWFDPTPGNLACTQQYGGPETATVKGTLRGAPIDAKFSRVNGCEITRWDAAKEFFEAVA